MNWALKILFVYLWTSDSSDHTLRLSPATISFDCSLWSCCRRTEVWADKPDTLSDCSLRTIPKQFPNPVDSPSVPGQSSCRPSFVRLQFSQYRNQYHAVACTTICIWQQYRVGVNIEFQRSEVWMTFPEIDLFIQLWNETGNETYIINISAPKYSIAADRTLRLFCAISCKLQKLVSHCSAISICCIISQTLCLFSY